MQPHSLTFRSSQTKLTGFVKKSLQPAARASCRSDCREEAVSATMMTGDLKSPFGQTGKGVIG